MLIATPYRDFEVRDKSPPRIISEIKKSYGNCPLSSYRPKLSGDVLIKCGNERKWWPRRVSIRCGQLLVSQSRGEDGPPAMKVSLRHLSIQAGPLPNSFALFRGQNVLLTLQTSSMKAFDEWVKTTAIELIRQTPLDAIKYLDILTFEDCWKKRDQNCDNNWNFNNNNDTIQINLANGHCDNCQRNENFQSTPARQLDSTDTTDAPEEKLAEEILRRCQNVQNYVPVKDKLFLFESMSRYSRKVRSTEDISVRISANSKKARSLYDLSNIHSHIAVRDICKYFETKRETEGNNGCLSFKNKQLNAGHHQSSKSAMNSVNKMLHVCNS